MGRYCGILFNIISPGNCESKKNSPIFFTGLNVNFEIFKHSLMTGLSELLFVTLQKFEFKMSTTTRWLFQALLLTVVVSTGVKALSKYN